MHRYLTGQKSEHRSRTNSNQPLENRRIISEIELIRKASLVACNGILRILSLLSCYSSGLSACYFVSLLKLARYRSLEIESRSVIR